MVLFKVLKRIIMRGINLEDMQNKLDLFFAANKITLAQYEELTSLLEDFISFPEEEELEDK